MPNTIQFRERLRGSDLDGAPRVSDDNPNLLEANRNDDGRWLNAYYDNPGNRWNRVNGFAFVAAQVSSFLLRHYVGGVLFCELAVPTSEHAPELINPETVTVPEEQVSCFAIAAYNASSTVQ